MILITKYCAYAKVYQAVTRKSKFHWFVWPCGIPGLLEPKVKPKMTSLVPHIMEYRYAIQNKIINGHWVFMIILMFLDNKQE